MVSITVQPRREAGDIKFKNPFQHLLHDHIRLSGERGLPMVQRDVHKGERGVIVCGAGPSLGTTGVMAKVREKAKQGWHIIGCKEAIRVLRAKNIRVHYSVSIDPRPEQADKTPIDPTVVYCIASNCHPALYDKVLDAGCRVLVFHSVCGAYDPATGENEVQLFRRYHGNDTAVGWGSSVANRAFGLAHVMGYPRVWLAGCDFGWRGGKNYYLRGAERVAPSDNGEDMFDDGKVDGRGWWTRADMLHSAVAMARASKLGYVERWLGDSLGRALVGKPEDFLERIVSVKKPMQRLAA